ncbi:MAG TPA: hypothetical protein VN897_11400 [Mycobacterium sp.]|nr:hypothetical protein [Mycobacterium sp.]
MTNPYILDPFQTIINVNFGGQWFFVWGPAPGALTSLTNFEIDFPGIEGGTPGFIPVLSTGFAVPLIFASYLKPGNLPNPIKLTAAMLAGVIPSNAGQKFSAFGFQNFDQNNSAVMFFKIDGRFQTGDPTFTINVSATGPTPGGARFSVGTVQKNLFKAGYSLVGVQAGQIPVLSRKDITTPLGVPVAASFIINTDTFQVSGG